MTDADEIKEAVGRVIRGEAGWMFFRDTLCKIRFLEYDDMVRAGAVLTHEQYRTFQDDPVRAILAMDDERAAAFWSLVMA